MWNRNWTKKVAEAIDAGASDSDEIAMLLDLRGGERLDLFPCLISGMDNGYWKIQGEAYVLTETGRKLLGV